MSLDLGHRLLHTRINLMHSPGLMHKKFLNMLKDLYSAKEAWLVGLMPLMPATATKIALLQFKRPSKIKKILTGMADRGLLIDLDIKGKTKYMIPVTVPGLAEFQIMDGKDTPEKRKFAREFHEMFFSNPEVFYGEWEKMGSSFARVIPVNKSFSPGEKRLEYEDVKSIINKASRFGISNCYCRREKDLIGEKKCDAPMEVCMSLDFATGFLVKHGLAREVDRETMLKILDEAEKHNLVHLSDNSRDGFTFICNCCGCCCGLLGGVNHLNQKPPFVLSSFIAHVDKEKCNDCGKCSRTCQAGALMMLNKRLVYSDRKCIGCRLCANVCPQSAISIKNRESWHEPPKDYPNMVIDLMGRRFNRALHLPFNRLPGKSLGLIAAGRLFNQMKNKK